MEGDCERSIPMIAEEGKLMVVLFFGEGGRRRLTAAAARTRMRAVGLADVMQCFFGGGGANGRGEGGSGRCCGSAVQCVHGRTALEGRRRVVDVHCTDGLVQHMQVCVCV